MILKSSSDKLHTAVPDSRTITRVELDNGIVVLVVENTHTQSVVMSGALRVGMIDEPWQAHNGLAAMTASALMMGTTRSDFDSIHQRLEDVGADLEVYGGLARTGFGGKALAEDLSLLVGLLAEVLREPNFPEDQVERLRGERLTWLQYMAQDTRTQVARAFRQALYPVDHPYHYASSGTLDTLPNITLDALRDFHRRHYGPQGMVFSIVGAVQPQEAIEIVRQYFGDWHNPAQSPMPALPSLGLHHADAVQSVTIPGKTQADLILGVRGPSRFSSYFYSANLGNSVLGQFGMMGRIGDRLREREGLAYYVYSRLDGRPGPGPWTIAAGVNPEHVERAVALLKDELRTLVDQPISADELRDNQDYFTRRVPLQLETNEGVSGVLLTMEIYQLGLDFLRGYQDMIYSMSSADIHAAFQRYWDLDNLVIAVAGPPASDMDET